MIIGECPYCENIMLSTFVISAFSKEKCDKCGKISWLKHSNINPESYTEKEFKRRFKIKGRKIIDR